MARPLRIEFPGAYYHVFSRGIEKREIFRGDKDRNKFLSLLKVAYERFGVVFHCYCLMNNHYHLFLHTPSGNLSRIMHYINATYSGYFNHVHKRNGHLLEGRYKAILVEPDHYAIELSRYIHLNPLNAGSVKTPEDYRWSSYHWYLESTGKPVWLDIGLILSYFSTDYYRGAERYRAFIQEKTGKELENPSIHAEGSLILGSRRFINEMIEENLHGALKSRDLPSIRALKKNRSMEEIVKLIEEASGTNDKLLCRKIVMYLCHRFSDLCSKDIGEYYGVSESAVSQASLRFKREVEQDNDLRLLTDKISKRVFSNLSHV